MELFELNKKIEEKNSELSALYAQKKTMESEMQSKCPHKKVIYIDGHPHQSWDYDWDHYHPEIRVCLRCGLREEGEHVRGVGYDGEWKYKTILSKPIRRFCVIATTLEDTIRYEMNASRTFGEDTFEDRISHYWGYVVDKLFKMPYASRVRKMQTWGYPAR